MDWLTNLIWHDGKFFGIEWGFWKVIGWLGNAVFFSRFFVQWYATERLKRVVVPTAFWWLSLLGSLLLLSYALFGKHDSVFIFALHPQFNHPPATQRGTLGLPGLRGDLSAELKFLFRVRDASGGGKNAAELTPSISSRGLSPV